MAKKVLILSGSPRKNGNSNALCKEFLRGVTDSGNVGEIINVSEKNIGYCRACYACKETGVCAINDDMAEILEKMIECDVLVLASPVYFYSIDAQLKALIDRTVVRWTEVKDKELYYIVTMADEELSSADTTLACFRGYADCIEGAKECGVVIGNGVYTPGEINGHPATEKAYLMGLRI